MAVFSIIVPVYNVEKEIKECLDSLKNQTFDDFEVLLVDDRGKDSSMDIVREYAKDDSRFKILTHEKNSGVSAARNTGLDAAQGENIMFVDSDDWLEPNALEVLHKYLKKTKSEIIMFNLWNCNPDGTKKIQDDEKKGAREIKIEDLILAKFVGVCWNRVYRKTLLDRLNVRFPVGLIVEDSDFTFKVCSQVKSIYIIDEPLYNYRREREGSYTTADNVQDRIVDEMEVLKNTYRYAREHGYEKKFRKYFLHLIGETTEKILSIRHRRRYIIQQIHDLLIEMDFPKAYKDMEARTLTLWMGK